MEKEGGPVGTSSSSSTSTSSSSSCSSSSSSSSTDSSSPSSSSSSSSYDSGSDDNSRKASRKRRHLSRTRSRKSSSSSRRSTDKELTRKQNKDKISRLRRGKPTKKKGKHLGDSECVSKIDQQRLKKRQRKKKEEKGIDRLEKQTHYEFNKEGTHKTTDCGGEVHTKKRANTSLQAKLDVQEQQKALIRRNAEIAKARLASGELQRARDEQIKMHQLYGTVDWRAKKKLRTEKRILERTVAAGNKLASLEERENARMDAFRVALGLPTAEAQRQAEWRAEATQALIELEARSKHASATARSVLKSSKSGRIGPSLPP